MCLIVVNNVGVAPYFRVGGGHSLLDSLKPQICKSGVYYDDNIVRSICSDFPENDAQTLTPLNKPNSNLMNVLRSLKDDPMCIEYGSSLVM